MSIPTSISANQNEGVSSLCPDSRMQLNLLTIDDGIPNIAAIALSGEQSIDDVSPMTAFEQESLLSLEETIEKGIHTFVQVGEALAHIKSEKLYRERFSTFEAYCQTRWNFSRMHAYRLIDASKTEKQLKMSPIGDIPLPKNEAQSRKLNGLNEKQKASAMVLAQEKAGDESITSSIIEEAVGEVANRVRSAKPKATSKTIVVYETKPSIGLGGIQYSLTQLHEVRQWILVRDEDASMVDRVDQIQAALTAYFHNLAINHTLMKTCFDEIKQNLDRETTVPSVRDNLEKLEALTADWAPVGKMEPAVSSTSKN